MNLQAVRFLACDVGTNALRMQAWQAIVKNDEDHLVPEATYRVPVRLGEDVFSDGSISERSANQIVHTFKAFAELRKVFDPLCFRAVATSAMRDATNGSEVAKQVRTESGIHLEIIDGNEEADLSLLAHTANPELSNGLYLSVDVGGGSTQVSVLRDGKSVKRRSFRIGAVRLFEEKVEPSEWDRLKEWLEDLSDDNRPEAGIAVGGNAEKLSEIGQRKAKRMSRKELHKLWDDLSERSVVDRMLEYGLKPDRADVIVCAAQIYYQTFKWLDVKEFSVPGTGIREGMVVSMFREAYHRTPRLMIGH